MKEIYSNLFIGSERDLQFGTPAPDKDWAIIHAARDPWFRSLSKKIDEELIAVRDNQLYLNLIDANDAAYIPLSIINKAIEYIKENIKLRKVFIHCNQGWSRAPGLGYIYLLKETSVFDGIDFAESLKKYEEIYPNFHPGEGIFTIIQYYFKKVKG